MAVTNTSDVARHFDGDCDGPGIFGCEVCNTEVAGGVCVDCGDDLDPWGVCDWCVADRARAKAAHPSNYQSAAEVTYPPRRRSWDEPIHMPPARSFVPMDEATPADFEREAVDDLCRTCGGAFPCPFHTLRVVS